LADGVKASILLPPFLIILVQPSSPSRCCVLG